MKITQNNLNEILFENQDARLLIEDVVAHTSANLYYYHDVEITLERALDIWYNAKESEQEELGGCSLSFLDLSGEKMSALSYS